MEVHGLTYLSYSTGNYGIHKAGGVTLQFVQEPSGNPFYVIFNADLKRKRNTKTQKAGSALPNGRFSVGMRSHFVAFWRSTGLSIPPRLSSFHDYMGKLKKFTFSGDISSGTRLDAGALRATLNGESKLYSYANNLRTSLIQIPDYRRTNGSDTDCSKPQLYSGITEDLTACHTDHGISKQGTTNTRLPIYPNGDINRVADQTHKEWFAEYDEYF